MTCKLKFWVGWLYSQPRIRIQHSPIVSTANVLVAIISHLDSAEDSICRGSLGTASLSVVKTVAWVILLKCNLSPHSAPQLPLSLPLSLGVRAHLANGSHRPMWSGSCCHWAPLLLRCPRGCTSLGSLTLLSGPGVHQACLCPSSSFFGTLQPEFSLLNSLISFIQPLLNEANPTSYPSLLFVF